MIKTIIFDCGRVFLHDPDNEIICRDIASACSLPYNLAEKTALELLPRYQTGELNDQTYWREFQCKTGCVLPAETSQLWLREYLPRTKIDHDVLTLVEELHRQGYRTPILSNTIPPHVRANRARNLFTLFQPEIFSCEVGARKPDPRIYLIAAERTGTDPTECVFIDDNESYITAANALRMHGILYQGLEKLKKDLYSLGIPVKSCASSTPSFLNLYKPKMSVESNDSHCQTPAGRGGKESGFGGSPFRHACPRRKSSTI